MYQDVDPNLLASLVPGGDLPSIHLENANLPNINLEEANLQGAYLNNGNFAGAHFEEATLIGVRANGRRSRFNNANFDRADLEEALFTDAHLERASFVGANLINAVFVRAHLEEANFQYASLEEAVFVGAHLEGAHFEDTYLVNANFRGAYLQGANFQAIPRGYLLGADFEGVHIDNNTLFNINNLSQQQRQQIQQIQQIQQEQAQPVIRPGAAFEIHNLFEALDLVPISQYLNNFNNDNNHPINPKTIPDNVNEPTNLFTPLLVFIDKSDLFLPNNKKERVKYDLQARILPRVLGYENLDRYKDVLTSSINFVSRQDDDFIEQYIGAYIQDCLEAYNGPSPESCVKGMVERIVTNLNEVANQLLTAFPENQTYNEIKGLFPNIDFRAAVQEWAQKYLEDGESEDELINLSPEQRKQHFIDFMKQKYGGLITNSINDQINKEAKEYERMGVFERRSFGGKRKTRRKRGRCKRKTIKRSKGKKSKKLRKNRTKRKTKHHKRR
jgi:uncharacterized protein YjbI with pentapeptide repeats